MSKSSGERLRALQSAHVEQQNANDSQASLYRHHLRTAISGSDERGDSLMKEGEKALKKLFSSDKYEKAAEAFEQAGAAYKMNGNYNESGDALVRAAELQETRLKNSVEACALYASAAKAYREVDLDRALDIFRLGVALHMENSRHESAARFYVEIADIEESENRVENAMESLQHAIDCFESTNMSANAVQLYARVAKMHIDQQDWLKAGDMYEKAANISVERCINKGAIHEWLYLAILAYFVQSATNDWNIDLPHAKYDEYVRSDRRHEGTREFQLIKKCFTAWEDENVKAFTKAIFDFDKVKNIDERESACWLLIKQALKNGSQQSNQTDGDDNDYR